MSAPSDRRVTEAVGVRKPSGNRAPGEQFPRGYGRPGHQHLSWKPCVLPTCGFRFILRPCRGRRGLKRRSV
jgi:hypothetical protein